MFRCLLRCRRFRSAAADVVLRRWELEFNQSWFHHAYRTCGASHYIPSCLTALLACYGPLCLSALGKPVILEGYLPSTFYSYGVIETSAEAAHHHIPSVSSHTQHN